MKESRFSKRTQHMHFIAAMIVAAMSALFPVGIYGQNNGFKIDDGLYKMYDKASKNLKSKDCLKQADAMYKAALSKGDKKAQCLAMCIPLNHYYAVDDIANLEKSAAVLKRVATSTNYPRYYYFAWSKIIIYYLNSNNTYHALQEAKVMYQDAVAKKDDYGIYNSLMQLGNVYRSRNQMDIACKYYKMQGEYGIEHLPENDPSFAFVRAAMCCREMKRYSEGLSYIDRAIKLWGTKENYVRALVQKAVFLYEMNRFKEFNETYVEVDKLAREIQAVIVYNDDQYFKMNIYHCILKKDYKSALAWVGKNRSETDRFEYYFNIYAAEGKWDKALEYHIKYHDSERKRLNDIQTNDLAEFSAEVGNERLRAENMQLELANANSKLEQNRLLAEKEQAATAMRRLKTDNDLLELRQQHTSDSLRVAEISAKRAKILGEQKQLAARHKQLIMTVGFMALLFILTIIYLVKSRQLIEKLEQSNSLLAKARDKAQESDRMKTLFIQNVSHEIRTPLNAIIGFTDLLVEPNNGLDMATCEEYRNIVHHNSDVLTGLVNDILTLSDLQSGEQRPVITSFPCNDLCRVSMATVLPRKSEYVEMKFETEAPDILEIETDEKKLGRIITHFLNNAIKFTVDGEIKLKCSLLENPGYVTFSVADTGQGVPAEKQKMLFQQFEKLEGFQQGMGLGLHISSLIAKQLKARIGIDHNYTGGARFYIAIPSVWSES